MTQKYTVEVKHDENSNNYYIEFPDEVMLEVGWKIGDTLLWKENIDGTFTIKKKD